MIKKHLKTMILTTIITLLPILAGIILWNHLPEQMPIHWNVNGEVDGWVSKPMAVFGMPALLAGLHWVCAFATSSDPKKKNLTETSLHLVLWLCPAISLLVNAMTFLTGMGMDLAVETIAPLSMGILFLVIGNYLPKCRQSYTVGIKIRWTLDSEANWNATHRFAGWLWMAGGIAMIAASFLGKVWLFMVIALVMTIPPFVYSYLYYRKHEGEK